MAMRYVSMFGVLALVASSACDKSATQPPATPTDAASASSNPEAETIAVPATWKEAAQADLDTQMAFMKANVIPAMKPILEQDGRSLTCATCHGPDNQRPHEFLPHLTMADGNIAEFTTRPDVSKFMAEQVVPAMAAAMGEEPYDPTTGQGFGCGGCHTIDPA